MKLWKNISDISAAALPIFSGLKGVVIEDGWTGKYQRPTGSRERERESERKTEGDRELNKERYREKQRDNERKREGRREGESRWY